MSRLKLTKDLVDAAVLGGCVLGGGGGGSMEEGRQIANIALSLSSVELVDIEDMNDDNILINVSAVGAPSAKDAYAEPIHYLQAVELMKKVSGIEPDGVITNEMGGLATVNGWLQAAMLQVPIVDAPCNGRAHPTGVMGAMGLHKDPNYKSYQVAVGGRKEKSSYIEVIAMGTVQKASALIRQAAVQAGGLVTVVRNPVTCKYAKENAALGAVKQAIELGNRMLEGKKSGPSKVIENICDFLKADVVSVGTIKSIELSMEGGFDVGKFEMDEDVEVTFWNEYMTLEKGKERIATFPDLIMTIDAETGMPLTSAEIREDKKVALIKTDRKNLKLGAGMKDPKLLADCGKIVGKIIC